VLAALQAEHILGTSYRTARLAGFVVTLWLLTPWWGRPDMLLLRCHLSFIVGLLGLVLVGVPLSPSTAMDQGRLGSVIWPIPPTEVAHFAAIVFGLVAVLWLGSRISGRITLPLIIAAGTILLLTHTRTALIGLAAGLLMASLSLFTIKARVRKLLASAAVVVGIGAMTVSGLVTAWLARGESSKELASFTGRTVVWNEVLSAPRDEFQHIFGFGISNLSFNGLPIDSNWLGAYLDLGLAGVAVCALMLLFPLVAACFQPRGVERALGLFLVTYVLLSTFTETGLSSPSSFMLDLTLAASFLVPLAKHNPVPLLPAAGPPAAPQSAAGRPVGVPAALTGGRHENSPGPQPLPLISPERREPGG
jgi:O-antigen ligase